MVVLDGRDHQAVHPPLTEAVYELALASGILIGAADEAQHPSGASHLLEAAMDRGEERVGHVLETRPTLAELQSARRSVLAVRSRR